MSKFQAWKLPTGMRVPCTACANLPVIMSATVLVVVPLAQLAKISCTFSSFWKFCSLVRRVALPPNLMPWVPTILVSLLLNWSASL